MNFTELEIEWLREECECCQNVAYANVNNEDIKVLGLANSMQNAINKILNETK